MNMEFTQRLLEDARNELSEYKSWFNGLPSGSISTSVLSVLLRGETSLKEVIKFYEKVIDESVEEEYLPFADEDFLEWEEPIHA